MAKSIPQQSNRFPLNFDLNQHLSYTGSSLYCIIVHSRDSTFLIESVVSFHPFFHFTSSIHYIPFFLLLLFFFQHLGLLQVKQSRRGSFFRVLRRLRLHSVSIVGFPFNSWHVCVASAPLALSLLLVTFTLLPPLHSSYFFQMFPYRENRSTKTADSHYVDKGQGWAIYIYLFD